MLRFKRPWQPAFMPLVRKLRAAAADCSTTRRTLETICRATNVVVLDEHQAAPGPEFAEVNDFWMNALPASSRGCALPAKMNCGALRASRVSFTMLSNCSKSGGALVGGEPPRKTDGQRVRIEQGIAR